MPGYTSQYLPIDFAIKRIAEHHFGGDEAAAWGNVQRAIDEGAITTASRNSAEDMLSYIVAGVVKSGTRRDSPKRKEPPAGTWLQRELEEIYDPIFTDDRGPVTPQASKAGRRSGTGGYDQTDAPLLKKMAHMMKDGKTTSCRQAAAAVVGKAEGGGTEESKIRRLVKKHQEGLMSREPL